MLIHRMLGKDSDRGKLRSVSAIVQYLRQNSALVDPDNLRHRVWAPALKAAELRHVQIYSLRHFYASALIAQGESIKYVSSQLGHASAQITIDRYGHLFPNEKRTSADRLEAMLAASEGGRGAPVAS
jgi:integrase